MTKMMKKISIAFLAAALLLCGSALALTGVSANESAGAFEMETGAEVRLDDPSGIRFITKVDQAFIDNLQAENPDKEISFGTEIKPEGKDVAPLDIPQTVWAAESTETVKYFKAVLTDIPESQYLTKLTATAYYAVDGVKTYAENPQTRSIAYVASAAIAAGNDSAELTAIIDAAVAEISLEEDFTLNVGEEKTLAVTGGEDLVVKFSTDNDAVATVDENGVVSAVGAGTANITATLGSRTDSVSVTVNETELKKLFYDFEDGTVGETYAPEVFAANIAGTGHNITVAEVEGNKVLAYDFDGVNDGYPKIIIKNEAVRALYETFGDMSFTLTNQGTKFHDGYYELSSGVYRFNLIAGGSVTVYVPEEHMKELAESREDFVYNVMNPAGTDFYENARFTYYLDNVRGAELEKVVEQGGTLSATEVLGKNAAVKSFAVYKDNVLVSEEGAENYTFTEKGVYTFECVQAIEGYEDSTVKGAIRVIDAVFDNVEDWYGEGKLIQAINAYTAPVSEEYMGANMLRMDSEGWWPRFELNKAMVEEFLSEGKTFTLLFRLSDIDGEHRTYVGQSAAHVSIVSGEEFAELTITPEKWEEIKGHADFASVIPVVTVARYEYGTGADGSDPFTMYLAGYVLS